MILVNSSEETGVIVNQFIAGIDSGICLEVYFWV